MNNIFIEKNKSRWIYAENMALTTLSWAYWMEFGVWKGCLDNGLMIVGNTFSFFLHFQSHYTSQSMMMYFKITWNKKVSSLNDDKGRVNEIQLNCFSNFNQCDLRGSHTLYKKRIRKIWIEFRREWHWIHSRYLLHITSLPCTLRCALLKAFILLICLPIQ